MTQIEKLEYTKSIIEKKIAEATRQQIEDKLRHSLDLLLKDDNLPLCETIEEVLTKLGQRAHNLFPFRLHEFSELLAIAIKTRSDISQASEDS